MKTHTVPQIKRRVGRPTGQPKVAADGSIRWTLYTAANEFNIHRELLARRKRALGIEPGPDGCFSSKDIYRMAFGDREAQQIGLIAAQRKAIEMRNDARRAELVDTAEVFVLARLSIAAARKIVLKTSMTAQEKAEVMEIFDEFEATDWTAEAKAAATRKR